MNAIAEPCVLDARPILAQGGTPCSAVDAAIAGLEPHQPLVLLIPFEPVPLYDKLGKLGFTHETGRLEDGTWRVEFRPTGQPVAAGSIGPCACSGH